MNKIFIILTIILTVIFSLFEILIAFNEIGSIPGFLFLQQLIINIIPILISLFINFIVKKLNWNKVVTIIVNILFLILTFFYFLFISLIYIF
nr:hypothetical protein [Candidatus Gastranaerophilales bacterium]